MIRGLFRGGCGLRHRRRLVGGTARLVVAVVVVVAAIGVPAATAAAQDDGSGGSGGFVDVGEGVHRPGIEALAALDVFEGTECGEGMFCPGGDLRRWEVAVWLVRVLDGQESPAVEGSSFVDVDAGEWWLPHVERLAELGVTKGCRTDPLMFCPQRTVNRAQMASFLVRAFDLGAAEPAGFADTGGSTHEASIDALAAAGVTVGCRTDPLRFCPQRTVNRAQMATLLARAAGLVEIPLAPDAFTAVSAGSSHACGLRTDGIVECWGDNRHGKTHAPLGRFAAVSAGGNHTCGLRTDGTIKCWGRADNNGEHPGRTDAPKGEFSAVSAGWQHSCGLRADGTIECWGDNSLGQSRPPRDSFIAVDAGTWHTCGIRADATIACWGQTASPPWGEFSAISAGWGHTCGLRTDGTVECWGNNADSARNHVGQADAPSGTFSAVGAAYLSSCGLRTDGSVECWGSNTHEDGAYAGLLDAPSEAFTAVSVGDLYACAVRADGSVECWGDNTDGQSDGPGAVPLRPSVCRPHGPPDYTAGFPLPRWAAPSIGTMRVAVLFVDFPDAEATHSTHEAAQSPYDEAALGLPHAEAYLEAASYGRLDIEFVVLHRWLRAADNHDHYLRDPAAERRAVNAVSEAVRLADPDFDFTGIHSLIVAHPSTLFGEGEAANEAVRTDEGTVTAQALINNVPLDEPRERGDWGYAAPHELGHNLGLLDLYTFDPAVHERPKPPEGLEWSRSQFGLMGLGANFLARSDDPRIQGSWLWPDGGRGTGAAWWLNAREMLAWSRWQLGWLDESQIRCISADEATVTLGPIADPAGETAMAALPLSTTEVIVIESRRKTGYDASREILYLDGVQVAFPALVTEGVLVYTVDVSIGASQLPMAVAGDSGNGQVDDYPILTAGQHVTVRGYTVTVDSDDGRTHTVTITKTATDTTNDDG